jgi:hypothetical protein
MRRRKRPSVHLIFESDRDSRQRKQQNASARPQAEHLVQI